MYEGRRWLYGWGYWGMYMYGKRVFSPPIQYINILEEIDAGVSVEGGGLTVCGGCVYLTDRGL